MRKESMERVSPIRLAYKRSWHDFASAKDQNQKPQLHASFAVGCKAKVFWSPSGTLYPKAASSLCVRCAAMLLLPPELQSTCNKKAGMEGIKLLLCRPCSSVVPPPSSISDLLLKNASQQRSLWQLHGYVENLKRRLETVASCLNSYAKGEHGESEPRSVGVQTLMA